MYAFVGYNQFSVRENCSKPVGPECFVFVGNYQVGFDGNHAYCGRGAQCDLNCDGMGLVVSELTSTRLVRRGRSLLRQHGVRCGEQNGVGLAETTLSNVVWVCISETRVFLNMMKLGAGRWIRSTKLVGIKQDTLVGPNDGVSSGKYCIARWNQNQEKYFAFLGAVLEG